MKKKEVAGILALFFGIFGVHRFYLGKRFWGVAHMLLFAITFGLTVEENAPFVLIPFVLGFIDSILLFAMPREEFDERYNWKALRRRYQQREAYGYPPQTLAAPPPPPQMQALPQAGQERIHKRRGVEKFRQHDYEGAIIEFDKALDLKYEDPATHFNLACCFSLLEEADASFEHLQKAVEFGFHDRGKIQTHPSLAYLRTHPHFESFVENGYRRLIKQPPPPVQAQPDETEMPQSVADNLLDQIIQLGELRDRGILTEEEFAAQKQKILGI